VKLKSYFSGTVEAAVEQARKELGEDALLVNARPATLETRHLGAYEVVFGSTNAASMNAAAAVAPVKTPDLAQDIGEMKREIERLARCLSGRVQVDQPEFYARLVENELDPMIARAVDGGALLDEFYEVDATLGRRGASRAVVALIGPPGVGKTTTLVKLAARFGLASRRPVQIITSDVFRIAAADQLRLLAGILGIGCDVVETPVGLTQALEEHRSKDFVFIDTPGLGRGEMEDGADLARMIATHPEIDTHLVLSASMKPADLEGVIGRYQIFQPKKLLFTRLDETDRFGTIINEASKRALPVSFLATGQQIPDDIEPATKPRLSALAHACGSTMKATA
jgi:flagellar biosynthesis protein FlhF